VDALRVQVLGGVPLRGKVCGIYKLVFPSGKGYVGQSRNIVQRWGHYSCLKNARKNTPVDRAVAKYGWANVKKLVLCECPEDELNHLEGVHMLLENTKHPVGYNLKDAGDAGLHHPATREKMRDTWAGKIAWTREARKQQAVNGGKERIAMDREKVVRNGMTVASHTEAAKAKRKATWDRKREEKLASMDPEKAAKVRWQAERDARRLQKNGPPEGYAEYQANRREEVRNERRARGWLG
jgi:group I intron endonuclease